MRLALSTWQLVICLTVTLLICSGPAFAAKPKGKSIEIYLNMGGKVKKGPWEASKKFKKGSFGHTSGNIKETTKTKDPILSSALENPGTVKLTVPNGRYAVMALVEEYWFDNKNQKREFTIIVEKQSSWKFRVKRGMKFKTKWMSATVTDGVLDIEFKKTGGSNPIINALVIKGTAFPPGTVIKDPNKTGTKTDPKKGTKPKRPTIDPAKVAAAVKARADAKRKQLEAAKARREAAAKKALEAALPLVEKEPVKAYFALKTIMGQYRGTDACAKAQEQAEELFSTPKTGRLIRPAIKEHEAGEMMKMAKSYVKLKRYQAAYDTLRKLIRDYRTTKQAPEAAKLLEQVRVLKKKAEEDAK